MANTGSFEVKAVLILLSFALFSCVANGVPIRFGRGLVEDSAPVSKPDSPPEGGPVTTPEGGPVTTPEGGPVTTPEGGSVTTPEGGPVTTPEGGPVTTPGSGSSGGAGTLFDVTKFGAKADDKTDNALAFIKTWNAACKSTAPAKVVVPEGKFVVGPVVFQGPCASKSITFEMQGYVKATTDLSEYSSPEWIAFERINGLILKGNGILDGQGASAWQYNDCAKSGECAALPDQLKFFRVNDSDVSGITSLNSKYFHYHVVNCNNITFHDLNITAPDESPNTDGIHISNSNFIKVINSHIGTGDDCVSIGQGTNNLTVNRVTCGPGHGISVGSLGKYQNEEDVSGIIVTNCTFSNTTNGARIKTYPASQPSTATTIIFEDLIMKNVKNPIIIDQNYGSKKAQPSKVKLNDVHFRNIRGSSVSVVAVNLGCSSAAPCDQVELANIDFTYTGDKKGNGASTLSTACLNAKVKAGGKLNPGTCPQ